MTHDELMSLIKYSGLFSSTEAAISDAIKERDKLDDENVRLRYHHETTSIGGLKQQGEMKINIFFITDHPRLFNITTGAVIYITGTPTDSAVYTSACAISLHEGTREECAEFIYTIAMKAEAIALLPSIPENEDALPENPLGIYIGE